MERSSWNSVIKKSYEYLNFLGFLFNFSGKGQIFIALNLIIFNAYMSCYLVHTIAMSYFKILQSIFSLYILVYLKKVTFKKK